MPDTSPSAEPKKRLALFLDGTWNTVSDNTNIWRLRSLVLPEGADGLEQRAYYSTGLGTKVGEKVRGGMFGSGIDAAIVAAYEWLVDNYRSGDEVFIFGFSRGAYTARSLSGFVSKCGLLRLGAPLGTNQLFMRYRREGAKTVRTLIAENAKGATAFDLEEQWMLKFAQAIPVKFIGIFDTVGALGVPFPIFRKLKGSAYPFLNTGLRQNNEYAFHAIAIDEHRKAFRETLWTNQNATTAPPRPIERTEQRWFVGAHANVGGGCFSDPLAQLPLAWLTRKAASVGLSFADFPAEPVSATAKISDSYAEFMSGAYRLLTFGVRFQRGIGVPPENEGPDVTTINETIDASVFDRWRGNPGYRPAGLAAWANTKGIDPAKITGSVRADDPTVGVAD